MPTTAPHPDCQAHAEPRLQQIVVRLSDSEHAQLRAAATRSGRSVSEIVRRAIDLAGYVRESGR